MKIAILGYGKEGHAVEDYFKSNAEVTVFDNFSKKDLANFHLGDFDQVFRSPSVPPIPGLNTTSSTKYFFLHCPAPIIGVTGTKGKGTTCSMLASIFKEYLKNSDRTVYLVGNIGVPAISVLDDIKPDDIVIYELSSFQLWDLNQSPNIAVVLRVEPDHLDRHADFKDYVNAKSNITRWQKPEDTCIFFKDNATSIKISQLSKGRRIPYPDSTLKELCASVKIPGEHNKENAAAAIQAFMASIHADAEPSPAPAEPSPAPNSAKESARESACIVKALAGFKPLPHHIEHVRTLNGVDYYDDSFSASYPSLDVALKTFENRPVVIIAGGKDRHLDLKRAKTRLFTTENVRKVVLIGETAPKLAENEPQDKYRIAKTLDEAVNIAKNTAESLAEDDTPVVLLSPGAASFDMFKDFYDRGEKFQKIVKDLK